MKIIDNMIKKENCEKINIKIIEKIGLNLLYKLSEEKTVKEFLIENNYNELVEELEKRNTKLINCGICYEDVLEDNITYLPCDIRHVVCDDCYSKIENKCPYCRENISGNRNENENFTIIYMAGRGEGYKFILTFCLLINF